VQENIKRKLVWSVGLLVFLSPLKFTVPVVFIHFKNTPQDISQWVFASWPNGIFYLILAFVALVALFLKRNSTSTFDLSFWFPPLFFLSIQLISLLMSVQSEISFATYLLFLALAIGYWLGKNLIDNEDRLSIVLKFWIASCCLLMLWGIQQANGGLDETRAFLKTHPEIAKNQPELWTKVLTNRIFTSFISPNSFGIYIVCSIGVIGALGWIARKNKKTVIPHIILGIILFYCLLKTGSKGSYLTLFLTIGIAALVFTQNSKRILLILLGALVLSIIGFGLGFGPQAIEGGKATWGSRTEYWRAAWKIGKDYPFFGTGPGTFDTMYPKYMLPGDEPTRLAHNNYIQMWSDSGFLGFTAFFLWLPGTLIYLALRLRKSIDSRAEWIPIWFTCFAFGIHSIVDFDLYMICNSWPIFLLLGALMGNSHAIPIPKVSSKK
jgi:O-antigen ligase